MDLATLWFLFALEKRKTKRTQAVADELIPGDTQSNEEKLK